jgi:hypothetical protein
MRLLLLIYYPPNESKIFKSNAKFLVLIFKISRSHLKSEIFKHSYIYLLSGKGNCHTAKN